ncbi:MAG: MerR family transcriptional regulator [Bacillota bacterium]
MGNHLKIGKLAEQMNLNPRTLRYYESIGLLIPSARKANGYRIYTEEDASKLRFIIRAKRFGLSLEEIRLLLTPAQQGLCETVQDHTRDFLSRKIEEITQRIDELQLLKKDLVQFLWELQSQKSQPPGTLSGCNCL